MTNLYKHTKTNIMKKHALLNILFILLMAYSFGQTNDKLIAEFETKNMSGFGIVTKPVVNFKLYNDSLVKTVVGGTGFKQYEKNNMPVKTVFPYSFKETTLGDITDYEFQDETISIKVTITSKKHIVLHRIKDNFSDKITEMMYY